MSFPLTPLRHTQSELGSIAKEKKPYLIDRSIKRIDVCKRIDVTSVGENYLLLVDERKQRRIRCALKEH